MSKKGKKKKGTAAAAADLLSPVDPREKDDSHRTPRFGDQGVQPSAPPENVSTPRSKGSDGEMKINEVSKGSENQSATSELTSTSRDPLYDCDDIEAIDSQLREFADQKVEDKP